jgi:hypothetical protein
LSEPDIDERALVEVETSGTGSPHSSVLDSLLLVDRLGKTGFEMHRSIASSASSVACDGDEFEGFPFIVSVNFGSTDVGLDVENTVKGPRW